MDVADFAPLLLAWFDQQRRDLPWRRDRDPYRIWVSEVMLQQTQVATVIPYFERFLRGFPTLTDLAAADEQDVLRLWEGLGYYRRARDLHRAARLLVADHGGAVPNDPEILADLPGMGRYTRGAVLSQAFDRRLPILEANSRRLLCRLFAWADDPRSSAAEKWLWRTAEELLPERRVGDFNQALMELGALVCTPTAPRCDDCPVRRHCEAHRRGLQEEIPQKPPPPRIENVHEAAAVVRRGGEVLLVQRPPQGRWAQLWEFPHAEFREGESAPEAARRVAAELAGLDAEPRRELATIRHAVTRFRIRLVCVELDHRGGEFASSFYVASVWVPPARLAEYPVSRPQRRLIEALGKESAQQSLF